MFDIFVLLYLLIMGYAALNIHRSKYALAASSFEILVTVIFFPILIIGALGLSVIGFIMEVFKRWMH
jgi:hypothetical protein